MGSNATDPGPEPLDHKPLAGLAALRSRLPGGAPGATPESARDGSGSEGAASSDDQARLGTKLVVQHERKKRGGKTVTRVRGLELSPEERSLLAREMKRALGCGASLDGDDVLLQGALVERAAEWLERRSGARVVRGN